MTDASDGSIRIGTAEREAAIAALGDHLSAGRLDIDEYADRSAQASLARTRDELVSLFADLPEPHPRFARPAAGLDQPPIAESADRRDRRPVRYGPPLAARGLLALPLLALLLMLAFHLWFFFLLIPLSGALFRSRGMAGPYRRYGGRCSAGWY